MFLYSEIQMRAERRSALPEEPSNGFSIRFRLPDGTSMIRRFLPDSDVEVTFLSHLLIAGCDIGVQISVRPFIVRPFVRPSTFTSKFSFLDISDGCESETLQIYIYSNCP